MANSMLIKLGGTAAANVLQLEALAEELKSATGPFAIIHGGGKEVTELSHRLGLEPVFHDGIRMTTEEEMEVVEMVLSGLANKRLVRHLLRCGVSAVGISGADGASITGARIAGPDGKLSRTARVSGVNPFLVRDLWVCGYVPVISSPASDEAGDAVNINADDVAFAIAEALHVGTLLFLSDVPGVLIDGEPVLSMTPAMAVANIANGQISGGMIPKVENAVSAISHGVTQVVIGNYEKAGDLRAMLAGSHGTTISEPQ